MDGWIVVRLIVRYVDVIIMMSFVLISGADLSDKIHSFWEGKCFHSHYVEDELRLL